MKNKLGLEMEQIEEISTCESRKAGARRDSPAPRIVVCPPAEEVAPERRGARLLRALSRRVRRQRDDDESGSSSGSDSSSGGDATRDSGSEASSEASSERRRHRSSVSLRRVLQSLIITPRSQSTAPRERSKKNPQPQRILRPPVTYTYVRGLSGLPTQRVPRPRVSGLNR